MAATDRVACVLKAAIAAAAVGLAVLASGATALNNGVGRTPALGYNTWNDFRCSGISAVNVSKAASNMVSTGLAKLGYQYINIDDCWCTSRDAKLGQLVPDPAAFPHGMQALAADVKGKGLRLGIYTDRGNLTCAGRPASGGHESTDAATFAAWGIEYVKQDSCNASGVQAVAFDEYGRMRDALNATGKPILFSLCGWAAFYASAPGASLGNSWRISMDCNNWGTIFIAAQINKGLAKWAGPGGFNDPDMLLGSSPGSAVSVTPPQARAQFSLWATMAAPLLIGASLGTGSLSAWDLATYSNTEVIAVDQDPMGVQGEVVGGNCSMMEAEDLASLAQRMDAAHRVQESRAPGTSRRYRHLHGTGARVSATPEDVSLAFAGPEGLPSCTQVWAKRLQGGGTAVTMVNWGGAAGSSATLTCGAKGDGCFEYMGTGVTAAHVRDLWAHKDLGTFTTAGGGFKASGIEANGGSRMYVFTPAKA